MVLQEFGRYLTRSSAVWQDEISVQGVAASLTDHARSRQRPDSYPAPARAAASVSRGQLWAAPG